ncbi:EAL domain-containing protein [Seongchinamella sediminis]|uniref:EAL domain-containing protein n=1 Tax=Seongchinamella sediminis TaxID=2283635 RepID=A0A3L7E260_9GAMM|nr:EAL domain-containing protein [Seongchinamella sediminis]RLQ23584.1 EAL domain-containing protein [Seongchinamella sediminis]
MTLHKKLWLAIIGLLLLVFSGSFLVTTLSAKSYLQQQISMKNADNAAALALSLSQQGADEVLLELTLSAQFDTGFYELIELRAPDGKLMILRQDDQPTNGAPDWFISLFPINVEDGIANVQDGWQQVGTLTLRSHSRFAYERLWQSTQLLLLIFLAAMLVSGFVGGQVLKRILKPLDDVVEQAQAIGKRKFITIPEPSTLEFRQVVSAMNEMSGRIKHVLNAEAKRLQKWQRDAHVDKITGLNNREPFMKSVEAALESDDVNATGSLSLVRIAGLAQMNQLYGRGNMDGVLKEIGKELNRIVMQHSRWAASRLNGSDFAILAPRAIDPKDAAKQMQDSIREVLVSHSMDSKVLLPTASTIYRHGDTISSIMTRIDGALLANEREGDSAISIAYDGDIQMQPVRQQMDQWRNVLVQSFREHNFTLDYFPVIGLKRELLHYEAPARLNWKGEKLSAGQFLPWINRLQLSLELDKEVVDLALKSIESSGHPTAANLSVAAVVEPGFLSWISERLTTRSEAAKNLWLEIPEAMAFRHLPAFKLLCNRVKSAGCQIGIEHMGHQLSELGNISDIGVDYLKVDASFVRDIDNNVANQTLLRTLCTVGHSIGVKVYAEGVRSEEEWKTLQELGADGATGPGISLPE